MSILTPPAVNTREFTFVRENGVDLLVTEHSDLQARGIDFGRVYNDACDVGLTIVSQRTGRKVVYAISHTQRDIEGDLMWWDLTPAPYQRNVPEHTLTVRIFND
jgi:hypothetical protein